MTSVISEVRTTFSSLLAKSLVLYPSSNVNEIAFSRSSASLFSSKEYLKSIEKKKLESNSQNNFNLLKYFDKTSKNFLRILSEQYNRIISSIFYEGYTFGFNIHCFMYNSKENDKNISKYNTEDLENKYRNVHLLPLPYISNSKTYDGSGRDDTSSVMVHHESEVVTFSGTKLSNNQENEEDLDDVVDIYTAMVVDNVSTTSENISIDDIDSDLALKEKDFLLQAKINAMSLKELRDVIQTRPTRRERIKALGKIKSEIEEEYSETTMDIVGISTGNDIESVDHRDITRKASTMSRVLSPNCLNELRTQMEFLQTRNNQEEEFCFDEDFAEI